MAKRFILVAAAAALTLAACTANHRAGGVTEQETSGLVERTNSRVESPKPFDGYLPVAVPQDHRAEPISLDKIALGFSAGTDIADLEGGFFLGAGCRVNDGGSFTGSDLRRYLDKADYQATFFEAMEEMGYEVVGDPIDLFISSEDFERVVYKVGAVLTDIELDLCMEGDWLHGRYTGRAHGSASLRVDWQIYSRRDEKRVLRLRTRGRTVLPKMTKGAIRLLVLGAFREAVGELGETESFLKAVSLEGGIQEAASPVGSTARRPRWEPMALPNRKLFDEPFVNHSRELLQATVSIRNGDGHGSGFFVTDDGYLLTNQHVVGNARKVEVRLHDGLELEGEVLRRDRKRDVALVKVPVSRAKALPIRHRPLAVGEGVYAIGTPKYLELSGTVSRGVVSAHRIDPHSDLPKIQADVDTHGGNSGGPLVDAFGNAAGITVTGITVGERKLSTGLNFFIPIRSALEHLEIALPPEPTS
ncbi:MAG: S1C family serine protease [Kiloniellales bacterium]|nr:S1C family serine protease [Kiloniellales bacterium]